MLAAACGSSSNTTSSSGSSSSAPSSNAETGGGEGGTLITRANAPPSGSPDPQGNYTLQEWQVLLITHHRLVGLKRPSGARGAKNVPGPPAHGPPPARR